MNTVHLAFELFMYAFAVYILFKKGDLGILYLPVIFFIDTLDDNHVITAVAYYTILLVIIIQLIRSNPSFFKNNYFALLLIIYFVLLMTKSKDLVLIRDDLFKVMSFFFCLPLIVSIFRKYSRQVIFKELATSAFMILLIFVIYVVLSTRYQFSPYEMYGISSGLMFGNLYATDFNVLASAIFIVFLWSLNNKNFLFMGAAIVTLAFISLSMRRSVMSLSFLGVAIVSFTYLSKNIGKILPFTVGAFAIGAFVVFQTNFVDSMMERYELRDLQDRGLQEEQRFFEYEMLYNDVFHYQRYSPWTGFDLFSSAGNYGAGMFYERSLHGDITSIGHSSGIIGIVLYFSMIFTAFYTAFKGASTLLDKLTVIFALVTFTFFCLTGRFTQTDNMMFIFFVAFLPLAKEEEEPDDGILLNEYEEVVASDKSLLLT